MQLWSFLNSFWPFPVMDALDKGMHALVNDALIKFSVPIVMHSGVVVLEPVGTHCE